jgi:hypothetical protein
MYKNSCFLGSVPSEIHKEVLYLSALIPINDLERNANKRKLSLGNWWGDFAHMPQLENNKSWGRYAVKKISTEHNIRIFDSFSEALDSLYFFLNY